MAPLPPVTGAIRRPLPLLGLEDRELVAVRVGEPRVRPPRFLLGLGRLERDAARTELLDGLRAVRDRQDEHPVPRMERPRRGPVPRAGPVLEQRDLELLSLRADGDPPRVPGRGDVRLLLEPDLLRIELQGRLLVLHHDRHLRHSRVHRVLPSGGATAAHPILANIAGSIYNDFNMRYGGRLPGGTRAGPAVRGER